MGDDPMNDAPEPMKPAADAQIDGAPPAADGPTGAGADLEALRADRDKYLEMARRLQADFENYQKRKRRETEDERRFAPKELAMDLLPVLDNLDRAMEMCAKGKGGLSVLVEGVELVRKQFLDAFAKHGIQPIEPEGQPFDPNLHQAILQQPTEAHPPMTVMHCAQKGFVLHDRVIRPASVVVAAPLPKPADPSPSADPPPTDVDEPDESSGLIGS